MRIQLGFNRNGRWSNVTVGSDDFNGASDLASADTVAVYDAAGEMDKAQSALERIKERFDYRGEVRATSADDPADLRLSRRKRISTDETLSALDSAL